MNREKAKEILGAEASEESITKFLNEFHSIEKEKNDKINSLTSELSKFSDYNEIKKQLDDINKANMTEQEKLQEMKKETEKNLRDSKLIVNKAKAKQILAELNLSDELIDSLVNDDEQKTIENATAWKNQFTKMREDTVKQTKETITTKDVTPSISNVEQNESQMTWDKFMSLSVEEQNKFQEENPDEFAKL